MLSCYRCVHLHNSASFKLVLNKSRQIITMILTMIPKRSNSPFTKHLKNDLEKQSSNIRQTFRCWLPFGSQLLGCFVRCRVCFATCFSEPLRGTPLDRFWPPLGHPWSDVTTFSISAASLLNKSKVSEQQMSPTTASKNKQGLTKPLPQNNPSKSCFTFLLLKEAA